MSTGFVLVLLREIRESILKLREEFNTRQDQTNTHQAQIEARLAQVDERLEPSRPEPTDAPRIQDDDQLARLDERLSQTLGSLARVESDLHELRKYMRQIALNQAKHEHLHTHGVETVDSNVHELR